MKLQIILLIACFYAGSLQSCSKWNDFQKYTDGGEQIYIGKLDFVKVSTGKLRVNINGILPADPKIRKLKITWNDGKDSAMYSINKTSKIDTINELINVREGIHNFIIQTFDDANNSSMVTRATGMALGPKYESGLVNRPVLNAEVLANGSAEIRWGTFDLSTGAQGTWVKYMTNNNLKDSTFVLVNQQTSILPDFKSGSSIDVQTVYRPLASIDDFFATSQKVNVMYDVTNNYIGNPGANFTSLTGGTERWQTPAIWITTPDVRNGGDNTGGIDASSSLPARVLSIEARAGSPVPNGKIYQSITLPAGKYAFITSAGDCSNGGAKYITVSLGPSLPNIAEIASKALVYKSFEKNVENRLQFNLSQATQVSLGTQASLTAEGHFLKVLKVKLLYSAP